MLNQRRYASSEVLSLFYFCMVNASKLGRYNPTVQYSCIQTPSLGILDNKL